MMYFVVFLLFSAAVVYAVDRVSSNYIIPVDDVTSGGCSSSSASYIQSESVIGQGFPIGSSSSAGYINEAGLVGLSSSSTDISDWKNY